MRFILSIGSIILSFLIILGFAWNVKADGVSNTEIQANSEQPEIQPEVQPEIQPEVKTEIQEEPIKTENIFIRFWRWLKSLLGLPAEAQSLERPLTIKAGCKGKERTYDYITLRTSLLADTVNAKPINPCMFKALMKIIDTEQKGQAMVTRNFDRKQIIKSVSNEIQLRNK